MKRIFGFIACLFFFIGAINVSAEGQKGNESFDYSNSEFRATVDMLSMDGHANDDLATCAVKQSYYNDVAEMFKKGMRKKEILNYYQSELGDQALLAPPVKGFNLSLWITPFLVLFIVTAFIYFIIKKWKRNNDVVVMDEGLLSLNVEHDIYTTMIDEERKKFL